MYAQTVADFYTAAWPDFTPPLTDLHYSVESHLELTAHYAKMSAVWLKLILGEHGQREMENRIKPVPTQARIENHIEVEAGDFPLASFKRVEFRV